MRHTRIIVTHYGGPDELRVVEEDCPEPKDGEARVSAGRGCLLARPTAIVGSQLRIVGSGLVSCYLLPILIAP